jgi:hypothetical protein
VVPREVIDRLALSFASAPQQPWFQSIAEAAMIVGFAASALDDFNIIRARALEAIAAGYPVPA